MARMPTFEEIREDFEREWQHLRHHETSAAPAAAAVTIRTSTPGGPVSLATIVDALKDGAVNADNWMHAVLGEHVPALIAEVERYQKNPIVQELELLGETMLPPEDIALITGIIRMAGKLAGQAPAAAPAQ